MFTVIAFIILVIRFSYTDHSLFYHLGASRQTSCTVTIDVRNVALFGARHRLRPRADPGRPRPGPAGDAGLRQTSGGVILYLRPDASSSRLLELDKILQSVEHHLCFRCLALFYFSVEK